MHLFLDAAGTSDHQQSSHAGHTARLCAFVSGLRLSAVVVHIRLSHGSPPQFPAIYSVDQQWLYKSVSGQSSGHPPLVWSVVKQSRDEDSRSQRSGGTVRPIFGAFSGWGVGNLTGSSCVHLFLDAAGARKFTCGLHCTALCLHAGSVAVSSGCAHPGCLTARRPSSPQSARWTSSGSANRSVVSLVAIRPVSGVL